MKKIVIIAILATLAACKSETKDDYQKYVNDNELVEEYTAIEASTGKFIYKGQSHWSIEEHIAFINKKRAEWELLKTTVDDTYETTLYMELNERTGYTEGTVSTINGKITDYQEYDKREMFKETKLTDVINIDGLFDEIIKYYSILLNPQNINNCFVEYWFYSDWPFPRLVTFECNDRSPDIDSRLIKVEEFRY